MIGWTGSPASTSRLVDKISLFKARQQDKYHHFLEESKACIQRMIEGFHQADLDVIKREILQNRELLKIWVPIPESRSKRRFCMNCVALLKISAARPRLPVLAAATAAS